MQINRLPSARRILREVHLWLGLALAILIVPVTLTGACLVFDEEIDALIHPSLFAVTGSEVRLAPDVYLRNAALAVPAGTPTAMRWPGEAGRPVVVLARMNERREAASGGGAGEPGRDALARNGQRSRPRMQMVFLDPPSAQVLGAVDFRSSLVGLVHQFHENLLVPEWSGRQVVGWIGITLLLLCLTGLWIWWPRNAGFLRGLRWRRGPTTSLNLHHTLGFWIAVPLGLLAVTGTVLAFPPQARVVLGAIAPMAPLAERPGFGPVLPQARLTAAAAMAAGLAAAGAEAKPTVLSAPGAQAKTWRLQFLDAADRPGSVTVDDGDGRTVLAPPPLSGDHLFSWMRSVHEGRHHGPLWRAAALLAGLAPTVLVVTGLLIWLRRRAGARHLRALRRADSPLPFETHRPLA